MTADLTDIEMKLGLASIYTYTVWHGPYRGARDGSSGVEVEVPEYCAGKDGAQAVRKHFGSESAYTICRDANGKKVTWGFATRTRGGGTSYHLETPREAREQIAQMLAKNGDDWYLSIEVTKYVDGKHVAFAKVL